MFKRELKEVAKNAFMARFLVALNLNCGLLIAQEKETSVFLELK